MSKLNKSAKKIKLPTDKSERQAVLKQRRLALARQTALSQKRPIRHTRNSVSEPPEDPIQTQTKSEGEKMETEEAGKHVTFRNTPARNGYQTDENVDKPESSAAVEPSKPKRNWRKPAGPTESHVKPASLRRPSGNPPCQSAGAKKNSSRKPNVPGPVKRSALLIAAAAATSTKKKILPEQKNKKKRAAAIDQDICHLCDLAVCPLEQLDEGEDEWVGCTTCPRWFHVGCLLPPDSEAAEYFNPDTFRCKFCAN